MAIWNPLVVVPVADMAIMTWAQLCVFTAQPALAGWLQLGCAPWHSTDSIV